MRVGGVAIDGGGVADAGAQEGQRLVEGAAGLVGGSAQEEAVAGAAHDADPLAHLALKGLGGVTIRVEVAEELEGRMALVVLQQVAGHLHRRVQDHPVRHLLRQRGVLGEIGARPAPGAELRLALDTRVLDVEHARRIVHRAAQQARVREDDRMGRRIARAPAVVLHTADAFPGHEVGPGAAQAGLLDDLVPVHHDLPLGGLLDHLLEVADTGLAVARGAAGQAAAGIAGLHRVNAQRSVPIQGALQLVLEAEVIAASLVVGDEVNPLLAGVRGHFRHVIVRRRAREVEVGHRVGIVPRVVPAFEQDALDVVGGGKVDVAHRILRRRAVAFPAPGLGAQVQTPPHADVLHRLDPGDIRQGAGLVQVQDEGRVDEAHGAMGDLDRPPRGLESAGDHGDEIPGRSRG